MTSLSNIKLSREVDGMDLSHCLTGGAGANREYVLINYGRGYFVRDKRYRLNQTGKLYDIPVTSDRERYSEKLADDDASRDRLQTVLDEFIAIKQEYQGGSGGQSKGKSTKKKSKTAKKKDIR